MPMVPWDPLRHKNIAAVLTLLGSNVEGAPSLPLLRPTPKAAMFAAEARLRAARGRSPSLSSISRTPTSCARAPSSRSRSPCTDPGECPSSSGGPRMSSTSANRGMGICLLCLHCCTVSIWLLEVLCRCSVSMQIFLQLHSCCHNQLRCVRPVARRPRKRGGRRARGRRLQDTGKALLDCSVRLLFACLACPAHRSLRWDRLLQGRWSRPTSRIPTWTPLSSLATRRPSHPGHQDPLQ